MGTCTLRTDEKEDQVLADLKDYYGVSTSTKALLMAARDVPTMQKKIEELEWALRSAHRKNEEFTRTTKQVLGGLTQLQILSDSKKEDTGALEQLDLIAN